MNLAPLSSIASAASKLLSAVTTQIGEYAEAGKLKSQSLIPAAAFLLGCLAIIMSLVEPNQPREWWMALPYDVKLLILASSGVLLILLSELGKQMGLLLRQFYSGEWPDLFWGQFRVRYLEQQWAHKKQMDALYLAYNQFLRTEEEIDNFGPQTISQAATTELPMLRVPINAYQLITESLVELTETKQVNQDGVIINPGDLIGRYATKALDAHSPVNQGDVSIVPRINFFQGAKVVSVKVKEPAIIQHLGPASIVSMIVRKADSWKSYDEIMILDRPEADTIVMSIREQDVIPLLNDLNVPQTYNATLNYAPNLSLDIRRVPGGQENLEFILTPTPEIDYLIGVPVAKGTIRPGQVIRDNHLQWKIMGVETATEYEKKLENILDRVYWPRLENGEKSNSPLEEGGGFKKHFLHTIPDKSWLTDFDSNGKSHERTFEKVLVESDEPIDEGDRLCIYDQKSNVVDRFCYVIQVTKKDTGNDKTQYVCYVAVSSGLDAGLTYEASPFDQIPVFKEPKSPGTLISINDIEMKEFRAGDSELFKDIYLRAEDVKNSYVDIDAKEMPAGKPIPRTQVLPTLKHVKMLSFSSDNCTFEISSQTNEEQGQLPQRGDLMSINLANDIHWDGALVTEIKIDNRVLSSCELTIPEDKYSKAKEILDNATNKEPANCKIIITHNDEYFIQKLDNYRKLVDPGKHFHDINLVISGSIRELDWITIKANEVCNLIDEMLSSFRRFSERPWKSSSDSSEYSASKLDKELRDCFWQHANVVTLWRTSIEKLLDSRDRGKKLTLPDFPETRATALGNVLAAAAEYPLTAYNIDTSSLLPRLILALGEDHKAVKQLNSANDTLSMLLLFSFWSALWTVIGVVAYTYAYFSGIYGPWWFLLLITPIGPLLSWLSKEAALAQAYNYGDAIKVLFDTERFALFSAMGIVTEEKDQITHEQEQRYWKEFFQLYVFGDMGGFPPVKLPELSKLSSPAKEGEKK